VVTANTQILIDDLADALGCMTPLGRQIVGPSCRAVRERILAYAASHDWTVVEHRKFVEWAAARLPGDANCIVLDPIFPLAELGNSAVRWRISRTFAHRGWKVEDYESVVRAFPRRNAAVSILDDAAATGSTLRLAAKDVID